jgi:hypothetical protein
MKLEGHPFPQNMEGFSVNMMTAKEKGKAGWSSEPRASSNFGAGAW